MASGSLQETIVTSILKQVTPIHGSYLLSIVFLLTLMLAGIYVGVDAYRRGWTKLQAVVWGLFATGFWIFGLALYLLWGRKIDPRQL